MKLKTKSKEGQKEFVNKLQSLFENPEAIVPQCLEGGFLCHFNGYRNKVSRMQSSGSFAKYAKSSDQLLRALSETYRIVQDESVPLVTYITTPYGKVEYARRGEADPAVLAGVQHHDDVIWRMLAFSSLVRTRKVRIFSSTNYYRGTCKGTPPGMEFYTDAFRDEEIQFTIDGNTIMVGSEGLSLKAVHMGSVTIEIFENSSYKTLYRLMRHIISPTVENDFAFTFDFLGEVTSSMPGDLLSGYLAGQMDDRAFIRNTRKKRLADSVKKSVFIIGDAYYTDVQAFLDNFENLKGLKSVRQGLEAMGKGLVMEEANERKVLETLWPQNKIAILKEIFPDQDEKYLSRLKGGPMEQIQQVRQKAREEEIDRITSVESWSEDSAFVGNLIMNYLKAGAEETIKFGEDAATNPARKAILWAFSKAVSVDLSNRNWLFSDTDKSFGDKLAPLMAEILKQPTTGKIDISALRPYIS